jgi:hypothetical protein
MAMNLLNRLFGIEPSLEEGSKTKAELIVLSEDEMDRQIGELRDAKEKIKQLKDRKKTKTEISEIMDQGEIIELQD